MESKTPLFPATMQRHFTTPSMAAKRSYFSKAAQQQDRLIHWKMLPFHQINSGSKQIWDRKRLVLTEQKIEEIF